MRSITAEIRNTEIQNLPLRAVVIVPPAGLTCLLVYVSATVTLIGPVGYTNVDPDNASLVIGTIPGSNGDSGTELSRQCSSILHDFDGSHPLSAILPAGPEGNVPELIGNYSLGIWANNGNAGAFADGDASNILKVTIFYEVVETT